MIHNDHDQHKKRIFTIIKGRAVTDEPAPTIAELQKATGLKSSASVHEILRQLASEKKITIIPNISRGIRLVDQAPEE